MNGSITRRVIRGIFAGAVVFGLVAVPVSAAALPVTMSPNPLPTAQINGIVWSQAVVGNKVYATGRFTQARPAGVAVGGAGSVTRTNIMAYDITTGQIDPAFVHSLSGASGSEGRAVAASPDGTRLYVGGKFSAADGQARSNFAVFDLTTNKLLGGFAAGPNSTVRAVAATNSRVYLGGNFSAAGGQTRTRLAAYEATGALAANWNPAVSTVDRPGGANVAALVVAPAQNNLVIGGYFNRLNGMQYFSTAAVKLDTGAPVAWATQSASFPIRDQLKVTAQPGYGTGITSLSTDGEQVYLTSYAYVGGNGDGTFEGRAAIRPTNGSLIWLNDCHGDSYSSFPIGQVLYSAGHAHDCRPAGGFAETSPRTWRRALAETTYPTGANGAATNGYPSFKGYPRGTILDWYPYMNTGVYSGANQGPWSVTGTSQFVSYGGEFTTVAGKSQQGLVRFGF